MTVAELMAQRENDLIFHLKFTGDEIRFMREALEKRRLAVCKLT